MVIGAGPAGIQAAQTLTERGFHVELYDENKELGGALNLANKAPGKFRMDMLIQYYKTLVEKNKNISLHLNRKITGEDLDEMEKINPYGVVLACGGRPATPRNIPGIEKGIPCNDIFTGEVKLSHRRVAVIGGGMSGLEAAECLVDKGNQVTIIEMAPIVGNGIYFYNVRKTRRFLEGAGAKIRTKTALKEIRDQGILVEPCEDPFISSAMGGVANIAGVADKIEEDSHKEAYEIPVDDVVLAFGVTQDLELEKELTARFERVVAIGDCIRPGKIGDATAAAYWRMKNL